ncbi:hypothetical protein MMC07_004008 [Pseudocyphellaria aurata]|nr:hypothetical protein [Pseudocyphellaria aurata]
MKQSLQDRLDVLCSQIQDAGFENIGKAMAALLNHTAINFDARTKTQRHITAFFESPGLNDVCNAITAHPQYQKNRKNLCCQKGIQGFATSISRDVVVQELRAFSRVDKMHIPLAKFSQPQIDLFSFEYLDEMHEATAPVLRSLLLTVIEPYRLPRISTSESHVLESFAPLEEYDTDVESEDIDLATDLASTAQRAAEHKGRNQKQVATAAISMLAYAHSKYSNYYQVIMGYHVFASGVKKRTMETFHQLGHMVLYESIVRALNANALATQELLRQKAQTHRFLLSFDNLNFWRHKRDQTSLNRSHMANYTAGFVVFMEPGSPLSAESVDHTQINKLNIHDLVIGSSTIECHQHAARAFACKLLNKYMNKSFCAQMVRNHAGKLMPKYPAWKPPLMDQRCSLEKADILPLPTLAKNKALIVETMDILQEYIDTLGISSELNSAKIMINGDLMTVRNITRSIHRRQDQDFVEDQLAWAEPLPGLFHTQMTVLKMMFGVFWGEPASTVSLCRYANLLRRKKITKMVLDFHHCDQFFLTLVEGFWLALIATECGCSTWEELEAFVAKEN